MTKPLSKQERQKVSRELAKLKEHDRKLDEIQVNAEFLIDNLENPTVSADVLRAKLSTILRLSKELGVEIAPEFAEVVGMVEGTANELLELKQEWLRQFKILEHREKQAESPIVMRGTLCINCNKREIHFDQYCKRCANELGIRPTGKV